MLPIVYHPDYQASLRPNHRFPMSKYGYLREALVKRGLFSAANVRAPAPFGQGQLELAHCSSYVDRAIGLRLEPWEIRQIGLPCTEQVIRRSRLSSAGTTLAAWLALDVGLACNAAGGSHHAGHAAGAGFCVFNDVAVSARNLLAQGVPGPMLILDADVHQGDGTAEIFAGDDRVFTISIHAERNYPEQKARSDLDVALPDGTAGAVYQETLVSVLDRAMATVMPRLIFYNAGVDVHVDDRLGRLALTEDDIRQRDRTVIRHVRGLGLPLVCVLGGGYSKDPHRLAGLHAILFEEAASALDL